MDKRVLIIKEMRKNRYTYKAIGETLGISRQRVYQILKRWAGDKSNKGDK